MRRSLQHATRYARFVPEKEERLFQSHDKPIERKLSAVGMRGRKKRKKKQALVTKEVAVQKAKQKAKRRDENRRRRSEMIVSRQECAYPAGEAHFKYEEYDNLGHVRESTSRRAPDVQKDRPQFFIPNGKKSEEVKLFVSEQ